MKKEIFVIQLLIFPIIMFSQTIKGGKLKFNNEIYTLDYFTQIHEPYYFQSNNKVVKTIFLNGDYNKDGIPDNGEPTYVHLNVQSNLNELLYATVLNNTSLYSHWRGCEIGIYEELVNTILQSNISNTSDNLIFGNIRDKNLFYRKSNVLNTRINTRLIDSRPLLFQAPFNYKNLKDNYCIVQFKFVTRVAKRIGLNTTDNDKMNYFYFKIDENDNPTNKKDKFNVVDNGNSLQFIKSEEFISSDRILWGDEFEYDVKVLEYKLVW